MIKNSEPVSMAECSEYVQKSEETDMPKFIKNFTKIKPEKAKEFRKELEDIDSMKINAKHISKVIDLLPENAEAINKIFSDVNLEEDETKKITATIKKYT
jgi:DNA-directed RNA polymerase subunit F